MSIPLIYPSNQTLPYSALQATSNFTQSQSPLAPHILSHDTVHFGRIENATGPIPPNSVVILLPGMWSVKKRLKPLAQYLEERGQTVHLLESPYNRSAKSANQSADWLAKQIDKIRLEEASRRASELLEKLEITTSEPAQIKLLQKQLELTDDALSEATAKAVLAVLLTSENQPSRIAQQLRSFHPANSDTSATSATQRTGFFHRQKPKPHATATHTEAEHAPKRKTKSTPEASESEMFSITQSIRQQLRSALTPAFQSIPDRSQRKQALDKTVVHVLDKLAPRVVIVGSSMGNFVGRLSLIQQKHDIALVMGLPSVGEEGTEETPPAFSFAKRVPTSVRNKFEQARPAIKQMRENSPETERLKDYTRQPFNTTIIATGTGPLDGLIGDRFRTQEADGRLNITATPQKAPLMPLADTHPVLKIPKYLSKTSKDFRAYVEGNEYHNGLTTFHNQYWPQDGELIRAILEAPKAVAKSSESGKPHYDYETGAPDYEEARAQIQRSIAPQNYEAYRLHVLSLLEDKLKDATASDAQVFRQAYRPLLPALDQIRQEKQPIENGVAAKAKALLQRLLEAPSQDMN